jgi:hypothetical protein
MGLIVGLYNEALRTRNVQKMVRLYNKLVSLLFSVTFNGLYTNTLAFL